MIKNKEKELKYSVSEIEYLKILECLNEEFICVSSIVQVNYYLETEDRDLKKRKISARIRNINNSAYELTFKIKRVQEGNLSVKDEYNVLLSKEEFLEIINNNLLLSSKYHIDKLLNTNLNKDLIILGSLQTNRRNFKIDNCSSIISLDKNRYLGIVDYELECEGENIDYSEKIVNEIFTKLSILAPNSFKSKNERFQLLKEVKLQ